MRALTEFIKTERGKERPQKVRSAVEYCLEILEESREIINLLDVLEMHGAESFLEEFTDYWENKKNAI